VEEEAELFGGPDTALAEVVDMEVSLTYFSPHHLPPSGLDTTRSRQLRQPAGKT